MQILGISNPITLHQMMQPAPNRLYFRKFWHLLARFAFLRTIFHALPIAGPLLAPLEGPLTPHTHLGCEPVLGLRLHRERLVGGLLK